MEKQNLNGEEMKSDLNTANIMVAGKTGTGKSTLLNAIFGEEVATTGTGRPVLKRNSETAQPLSMLQLHPLLHR